MNRTSETPISRGHRMLAGATVALFVLSVACDRSPQAQEARFLSRGKAFLAKKDYTRAYLEFKNAQRVMPKDGETFYQVGLTALEQRDIAGAADAFLKATQLNPNDERAQLKLGELAAMSGKKDVLQVATSRLESVLANSSVSSSDRSDASDALALAEWKLGKNDEALERLEDTLQKFPTRLHTSVELARLKMDHKDLAGAEQVLKQAVSQAPESSLAELALGQIYLVTNRPAKAEPEFRKAVQLDAKNKSALIGLATIQRAGKRMDDAEETYRLMSELPSVEMKPQHALFLYSRGKRDAALAEFEKLAKEDPNDRGARTRLFKSYVGMGKMQDAQNLVTAALKNNPKDTDALLDRAGLSLVAGNLEDAEKDLGQVLYFKPDFARGHAAMAEVDKAKGQPLFERQELNKALRLDPSLLQARLALAENFIQANEAKSALDVLDKTPTNQQGNLAVVAERNWALLGTGDTKQMRSVLDQALKIQRLPELVIQDGVLRLQQGEYAAAIADAEEAIKANDLRGARLLGGAYLGLKQPAKAEERLKELAAANPKSASVANLLGTWYLATGNSSAARKAFEAALTADPKLVDASLSLAGIDIQEKHSDAARQRLLGLVAANPKSIAALVMLGVAAGEMGDQEEAVRRYRAAVALDSSNVVALNNLAYLLAFSQPDEALKYAQQAGEIAPDNATVQDTLGWVYYRKAIYSTAVTYLEMAVAKEPTPKRQFHLASSYLKAGKRDAGEKTMRLALRQDPNLPVTEKGW